MSTTVASAISTFGKSVKAKLSSPAIEGAPEDQLRGPLENLFSDFAELCGLQRSAVRLIGETTLGHLKTRPDYAVTVNNALIGFIEVKAPGKGADPRRFNDPHDKEQWAKLKALPNILYTDGGGFGLWHDGEIEGRVVALDGEIETAGAQLGAPPTLLPLIESFLQWDPQPIRRAKQLAQVSARLCRLLRDEVIEQMALGSEGLTALAQDWRKLLFPEANDETFADGYAQAVTFGLLVARARDISLAHGIEAAAQELRQTNSLIGTALRLLTDDAENQAALKTGLGTLTRVLEQVVWADITRSSPEAWLYFYEDFLEVYDNKLRKRTGSYYTPPEVVDAMVRLVDECLRGPLFDRPLGLASPDVTIADPAVGTGTFLLGVLRRIAGTVTEEQGAGAVRGAIEAAAQRVVGFELQFGPFAVAQLRIIAEMQALMSVPEGSISPLPEVKLFIADTLSDPFVEEDWLPTVMAPVAKSRRDANRIKREQPITVVIGNPPYKNQAGGMGSWVETGSGGRLSPMDFWLPPQRWRLGAHANHLKNLYVYFWRWASLKVFGSGWQESTGKPTDDRHGVVCFITAAGFLNGSGFQKMREELRRDASDIWVIDCSPEGHQPDIPTRIFQGVQQPICIVLAARPPLKDRTKAATLHFTVLPDGKAKAKFDALQKLTLNAPSWIYGAYAWREPFLPEQRGEWSSFPALSNFMEWSGPGVKTHRTWVITADSNSLSRRWDVLTHTNNDATKEVLFHSDSDRDLDSDISTSLGSHPFRSMPVRNDKNAVLPPIRYAFRSFDRQWIIPDHRLLSRARPELWKNMSATQIYVTGIEDYSPTSGPALTITALIPDQHHYHGRGGRVYPLWRDATATQSNIRRSFLIFFAETFGKDVSPEDVMAYFAALMAHPAFTKRFAADLMRPGLRVPLTADTALFAEATSLGSEIVWLHCYGERFADPAANRPKRAPRLPKDEAPTMPAAGAIPGAPEPLPDTMEYDPARRRLHIGKGYIDNVTPAIWAYEVSGKNVLRQWFSYRKRDRTRPIIGDRRQPSPLDQIQPDHWLAEYTSDLIDLLNVLGRLVKLEPAQADLLERICAGPLLSVETLRAAGAIAPRTAEEAD